MILLLYGFCRWLRCVQRGATSLAYWGIFSVACNAARTNSLISYGIFSVNTLRRAVCLPFGYGCPCRLLTHITPPYFFPFGRWVAGRSFSFSKALLDTRFSRQIRSQRSERKIYRETAQPLDLLADVKPRACFAFVNGNDCSAFL